MTKKQGCGEEGETREAKEGKQEETRRWVSMGRRGDPGEIQGRSIDLRSSVFRGVGGGVGRGTRREGRGVGGGVGRGTRREGVGAESKVRG